MNESLQSGLPLTIRAWLQAYANGVQVRDLLTACLERVQRNSPPGVWIHLVTPAQLEKHVVSLEAEAAAATKGTDALLARFPLFGVPFAVKDNIDMAGMPTTAACPAFHRMPISSANAVSRLKAAGAICIGKTNLDQFATGLVGTRSPYGRPSSVFSDKHISGGSSSGSAVAVASGLVAFALGTDTAGSGRVPAAFNQVVGLKPTPGRVGTSGVLPACRTLDCVSVFALTVEDAAHVLSVIEGPDELDSYSRFVAGPAKWMRHENALRVGVPDAMTSIADDSYETAWAGAVSHARGLGHTIVPVNFATLHATADLLYSGPWVAERHSVVKRLLESEPESFDPEVRAVIRSARRFSATNAFEGQYQLKSLQRAAEAIWRDVDVLMVPTAPFHPTFDQVTTAPLDVNNALGVYTNFVNLLGWCALALPAGRANSTLPFGVSFIAPANHDAALVAFARTWEASLDLPLGGTGVGRESATVDIPLLTPAVQASLPVAVVGAHMSGMPLNGQLTERGASLLRETSTSPDYRLYVLPATSPPKPGLVRVRDGGHAIALELWDLPVTQVGSFLALIPAPLGLGSLELADGRSVHGFLCESHAVQDAEDVSHFGGWRSYMNSLAANDSGARYASSGTHFDTANRRLS